MGNIINTAFKMYYVYSHIDGYNILYWSEDHNGFHSHELMEYAEFYSNENSAIKSGKVLQSIDKEQIFCVGRIECDVDRFYSPVVVKSR